MIYKIQEAFRDIRFYLVVNSEGQFYRAKGRGSYGSQWVDEAKDARVYLKIGPARSAVTSFSHNTNFPVPNIVAFSTNSFEILDETNRVEKAMNKIKRAEATRDARIQKDKIRRAQQDLDRAKQRLKDLK